MHKPLLESFKDSPSKVILEDFFNAVKDTELLKIKNDATEAALILREYQFSDAADCCYFYPLAYLPEFKKDDYLELLPKDKVALIKGFQLLRENKESISKKQKLIEGVKQLMVAASFDLRIIFIRLGLWLNDLRRLSTLDPVFASSLAEDTLDIYSKIAHRLGLYKMGSEMVLLSFRFLKPLDFDMIQHKLKTLLQDQMSFYQGLESFYRIKLEQEKIEFNFSYRTKEIYSIYLKSLAQPYYLENHYDIIACRFLVKEVEDCYKVLAIVHAHAFPIPGRFKDYINQPKLNGYRSLHTTVKGENDVVYEVQIRTFQMHEESEYGFAAHWQYKEKGGQKNAENAQISWLRNLVSEYSKQEDFQNSFEDFQKELIANSIYVFTPQGKMIRLPKGASVIDFAYAIHSQIGNTCIGAKVDGKFSPIRKLLENGNQIEVVASPQAKPNRDWLEYAVTAKATYHIRTSIKQQSLENAESLGEKILLKALENAKIETKGIADAPAIQKFLRKKSFLQFKDLLRSVGFGATDIQEVVQYIKALEKEKAKPIAKFLEPFSKLKNLKTGFRPQVSLSKDIPTRIAQCCQPLPGDRIVGLISNSGMVKIHRAECSTLQKNNAKAKAIDLYWKNDDDKKLSLMLSFAYPDTANFSNAIVKVLADLKVMILQSHMERDTKNKQTVYFNTLLELEDPEIIHKIKERLKKFSEIQIYQQKEAAAR